MNQNKLLKNASWIIACKIVQSLIALIVGMISARYLGPSNYGLISYAASLVTFAVPLAQLGLRGVLVEEIVSNPEREGKTLGTALGMSLVSSLFCVLGIAAFVSVANAGEPVTLAVCLLSSVSLVFQMTEMIQYWYQAKLLSQYTSIISLAAYTTVSLYKVFLLVTQKSIYWFAVATAFDYAIISLALLLLYRRLGTQKLSFSIELMGKLFSRSKYYILSGMMVVIFSQTDRVMLKMMMGDAENGYYTAAAGCAGIAGFVFQAIVDSFRPVIFRCKKTDTAGYERNLSRLYGIILYLGLAQSLGIMLLSGFLVRLMYGDAYLAAVPVLQILTWYTCFSYLGSVRNIWMLAEEKQRYLWILNLSGAVLNVLVNWILIPVMGAAGAALATVTTQGFTNLVLCFVVKPIRPTLRLMLRGLDPRLLTELIPKRRS